MTNLADKPALRAALRQARAKIAPAEAEGAARAIAERALSLVQSLCAEAGLAPNETPIALYAALPGELDCLPLIEKLAAAGFPTLLPVAGEKATPLAFRAWKPGEKKVVGRYRLSEPGPQAREMTPKIVFTPLLGFDLSGGRLGFGGGYYDATLANLRRGGGLIAAGGLAYSCQGIEKIPSEKHDQKLDFVITEKDVFTFSEC